MNHANRGVHLVLKIHFAFVIRFGQNDFTISMFSRILIFAATLAIASSAFGAPEEVILLHGLCRTPRSMTKMERALVEAGYTVQNVSYPSRTASVQQLADDAIGKAVSDCQRDGAVKINFVAHSLGTILVRSYLARHSVSSLGRAVMLAPPNQGSEVADKLGGWFLYRWINGPAGIELGTGTNSVPNALGPANYPVGIVAGDLSINWINSLLIPGRDDGKVSVERTGLAGMRDQVVIHTAHPFIMLNHEAIRQTIQFLREGRFEHATG